MLTIGSLFSGIGGLELGLERAGMQTIWQVERDPYCRRVLAKHWPNAQRFDDVCAVGAYKLSPVDLICGGFPCQDISTAGKGAGITEGSRSGLWFEYRRIIRELRPSYVVVENVAALLARGLDTVLGDLAACGYDAEWDCIPAAAVGAPHRRDRLFIVAYADNYGLRHQPKPIDGRGYPTVTNDDGSAQSMADTDCPRQQQSEGCVSDERRRPSNRRAHVPHTAGSRLEGRHQSDCYRTEYAQHWETEPRICRVVDGVPNWAHRIRSLGNAVVPQVAEYIGRLIMMYDHAS